MKPIAVCALVLSSFGVLASPLQAQDFVSVYQVMDDMVDTPYECADYDPATDSCSSVSLMYAEEGILYNTAWFALPNPGGIPWVFQAHSEYETVMGWGCTTSWQGPGVTYSSGGQPDLGETYARQIQAQLAQAADRDEPCAGYYPTAPGQYQVRFRHRIGDPAPRAAISVRFFAMPKPVRP